MKFTIARAALAALLAVASLVSGGATAAETFPTRTLDSQWGFAGPKGMDPAVVQKIHDAFKKSLDDPKVLAIMDKHLMAPNYADARGYLELAKKITAFEAEGVERIGLGKD